MYGLAFVNAFYIESTLFINAIKLLKPNFNTLQTGQDNV